MSGGDRLLELLAVDDAAVLGLCGLPQVEHRNTVSQYQTRYPDMPRPVNLGPGRPMLWLRPEIERWHAKTAAQGRTRLGRRASRPRPTSGPSARRSSKD